MGADIYYLAPSQASPTQEQSESWRSTNEDIGYFRDPYNDFSTLWLFDLSWWDDVGPWLNRKGELDSSGAAKVLQLLGERADTFESKVARLALAEQDDHRQQLHVFRALLERVVSTPGARLYCWI